MSGEVGMEKGNPGLIFANETVRNHPVRLETT